jgi:hypothetical protein
MPIDIKTRHHALTLADMGDARSIDTAKVITTKWVLPFSHGAKSRPRTA